MLSVYSDPTNAPIAVQEAAPTETQRVYRALKRAILGGAYRPGEALQEVRLSAQYGASRTPIREALQRLEADGLLLIVPRRGAFVHQPTMRDLLDVNELRLLLEPAAARAAASVINEELVAELQAVRESIVVEKPTEDDFRALEDLDRRMHATIANAIDNARMARIIQSLNDMMQVVREKDMRRRHGELHMSIGGILAALRTRDADTAELLLRRHISDFSGALRGLA